MIIFILTVTISPSGYFTYGDFSNGAQSYSLATYWTIEYKKNYFLFAYDNYTEEVQLQEDPVGNVKQNLFSVGYARELLHSLGVRGIGSYIFDLDNNISWGLSPRILYGYNPVFTLGYATYSYSKQWGSGRKFYTVYQITSSLSVILTPLSLRATAKQSLLKKMWLVTSPCYITAGGEKYLSISGNLSLDIGRNFNIELGGMIGERFYYIDDKLLIVNNRPNVEKGRACVKLNYRVINKIRLVIDLEKDFFTRYNINYYALGLKIEL